MRIGHLYSTIDTQVLGEAFRIVIQPPIRSAVGSLVEKKEQLLEGYEQFTQLLLNEPRGYRGMNGCIILPSSTAAYKVCFFNHPGSIPFKLEGVAASLTTLLETGNLNFNRSGTYHVETSYGILKLQTTCLESQVIAIQMEVPMNQVTLFNEEQSIYNVGKEQAYAVRMLPAHIDTVHINYLESLESWGKEQLRQYTEEITGVILAEKVGSCHYKTVTYEADGYIRRTPGIVSSMVLNAAFSEEVRQAQSLKNETIFGSTLVTNFYEKSDVMMLTVRPFITGLQDFVIDPTDPLPTGFLIK